MDEPTLRGLIDQVKGGHLSRRLFLQAMAALGIGAPLAAQMLASAGVAAAQPREPYLVPLRRGGGGDLRILMWDAPTMLHPHFGRGLRDMTASRLFYEPLAAPAARRHLRPRARRGASRPSRTAASPRTGSR